MEISPYIILIPGNKELIAWDFMKHAQYRLTETYANRLTEIAYLPSSYNEKIQSTPIWRRPN